MSEGIIVQLITTLGVVLVAVLGNNKLNRIGKDTKATLKQTENDHQNSEYPNLRDELTAFRKETSETLEQVQADIRGTRKDVTGLRVDDGLIRKDVSLAVQQRREEIQDLRDEIPGIVRRALVVHGSTCPIQKKLGEENDEK